ncbi:MAG: hypothetical protein MSS96_06050 [Bacteroidales bacterium]|nr:hypothetical protein [Bacteroidales bacterium]
MIRRDSSEENTEPSQDAGFLLLHRTEVKPEQSKKAQPPIEVTLSGMVTEGKLLQKWNVLLVDYQYYTL